ncbi:helix-hairpin-helix domain-containing protein [Salinisphaera sp. SPP-AMP-43]|uniref:ComEA family DNA-binding protein n=1 Tax=Salinisphaera sp. SPP-AMP-43 TaxID=3121288 RepID=UPI003C6E0716
MKKLLMAAVAALLFYAGTALAAVDVNTATAAQLETLDGIGSVKAQAIIADRKANGDYQRLDQLTRVDGIGAKTVEGLRSEATVGKDSGDSDSDSTS